MKLLLTSNGLTSPKIRKEFATLLEKKVETCKVAMFHTLQKPEYIAYVHQAGEELRKAGILLPHVRYVNIQKERSFSLKEYDAVYVCGGNTYFIADHMRASGFDKELAQFAKRGGVYVGVSAGSILAAHTIEIAGWGSEADANEIGLKNLKGLGLTDIAVFPHYKARLKKEVESFKATVAYPVETLKEREALTIQGKSTRKISS